MGLNIPTVVHAGYGTFATGMNYVYIIVNIFEIRRQPVAPDASAVKTFGGC